MQDRTAYEDMTAVACPACRGKRTEGKHLCSICRGRGTLTMSEAGVYARQEGISAPLVPSDD